MSAMSEVLAKQPGFGFGKINNVDQSKQKEESSKTEITRSHDYISYEYFSPILEEVIATTNSTEHEIMKRIGYSGGISEWRRRGRAPRKARFALLGLMAELKIERELKTRPIVPQFTYDELVRLFGALHGMKLSQEHLRELTSKIAAEIQKEV